MHPIDRVDIDHNYETRRFLTPRSEKPTTKEAYTMEIMKYFNN